MGGSATRTARSRADRRAARAARAAPRLPWGLVVLLLAAAAGAAGLAACAAPARPWASTASAHVAALHEALRTGFSNAAPFYAPGVRADERGLLEYEGVGRSGLVQAMRDSYQQTTGIWGSPGPAGRARIVADEPAYLSRDGLVDPVRDEDNDLAVHHARVMHLGAAGITDQTWVGSITDASLHTTLRTDLVAPLARGYLAAWSSGSPAAVRARYAPGATLADTLDGLDASGPAQIGALAPRSDREGGLRGATLRQLPRGGGPAVYLTGAGPRRSPRAEDVDTLVLLVDRGAGERCPEAVAVVLALDGDQRITREERFHRVDALRSCRARASLPSGWWDEVSTPDPHLVRATGGMQLPGGQVWAWNGTPQRQTLVAWAAQRFAQAHLDPPDIASVTFLPQATGSDPREQPDPMTRFGYVPGTADLLLPASAPGCPPAGCVSWPADARAAALEQLAQRWVASPARAAGLRDLARSAGTNGTGAASTGTNSTDPNGTDTTSADTTGPGQVLPGADTAQARATRTLAAQALARALMDEPSTLPPVLAAHSCPERLAALVTVAPGVAGSPCLPGEDSAAASLATAQAWFARRSSALRQGVGNLVPFYDPAARMDHRSLGVPTAADRDAALALVARAWAPGAWQRELAEPVYVSSTGSVVHESVADRRQRTGTSTRGTDSALVEDLGPRGIRSELYAPDLGAWRALTWRPTAPPDRRPATAAALADDYLQAWSSGDAREVAALYAGDPRVEDSLLGVRAQGSAALARLARAPAPEGGLPSVRAHVLELVGEGGVRGIRAAAFAAGPAARGRPLEQVVLLLDLPGPCPDQLAAVLDLDRDGRIRAETRYHRLDAVLRCTPARAELKGWWQSVRVPDAVLVTRTGRLRLGDSEVDVYNGSPALEGLLGWAEGRFAAVGLAAPSLSSVTFHDPDVDACRGITGQIWGSAVTLCFQQDTACTDRSCRAWRPFAKETLLHELGHAWLAEHADAQVQARFLRRSQQPSWADPADRWQDRGVELAASTLAWGLMDVPFPSNPRLGTIPCSDLAAYYQALVGRPAPATAPCS